MRWYLRYLSVVLLLDHVHVDFFFCNYLFFVYFGVFFLHLQGSSFDLIKKEQMLCETLSKFYTKQILEGLNILHLQHIMHQDLKGWFPLVFDFFFVKLNLYYNKREKLLTILILDTYPNYSTILYSYKRHATYNKILT